MRRAQASNVAQGGNVLFYDGQRSTSTPLPSTQRAQFDEDTAARQWDKLQQAQEVSVSKVLPLRVNLPTHGVRHIFMQVLQTEVKIPMTVSFDALNTRSTSWPFPIGLSVAGFAALWLLVAGILARRER